MPVHGVEIEELPSPKKSWMSKSKLKTMLICFFDIRVITHFEFVPEGTTVNQTFYGVLKRLIDAVRRKQDLWRDHSLILCYDNMPAHPSLWVWQFWAGNDICHGSSAAPADLWLLPKFKIVPKGKCFSDVEDVKSSVKKILTYSCSGFQKLLNIGRRAGNIVKNWREITLKNSRLLIKLVSKLICLTLYGASRDYSLLGLKWWAHFSLSLIMWVTENPHFWLLVLNVWRRPDFSPIFFIVFHSLKTSPG
jgi:hypothetical protein